MPSEPHPGAITVLSTTPRPHARTNPFVTELVSCLPSEINTTWFSWRAALTGHYDLVHAHWPELALRASTSARRWRRAVLFALWLVRLRLTQVPVVRTLHNSEPHESGRRLERFLLRRFDAATRVWLPMNTHTPRPAHGTVVVVPHGHYRHAFSGQEVPEREPDRLLMFGYLRRYKGVPGLLQAFSDIDPASTLNLRIVGWPHEADLREEIIRAATADPRISAEFAYVDDSALATEIGRAVLVVLPYERLQNSGALLLALSLDRPVLVPDGDAARAFRQEFGADWIHTYPAPLSATDLEKAARSAARLDSGDRPDLRARDWPALGQRLAQVYRDAVRRR